VENRTPADSFWTTSVVVFTKIEFGHGATDGCFTKSSTDPAIKIETAILKDSSELFNRTLIEVLRITTGLDETFPPYRFFEPFFSPSSPEGLFFARHSVPGNPPQAESGFSAGVLLGKRFL
jgi:hypothetical protein